ncbi:uncharacterized protein LOC133201977 [Saccostrea echinata]|uniref:uncharacterized protein LOC133201977 n=1 Tax=Saccostrea echinata TaxID=191078 RepID=UPI002A800167|nr:uncharacterized protein LOC133201977 [Saccostrea echinata]
MSRSVLQKSVTVPGVSDCSHISRVTSDRVWISDEENLVLTNTAGDKLHHLTDIVSYYGGHTVNGDGDLIYIDSHGNINKLSTDNKVKTTLIEYTASWYPQCVYSSPFTGDLLVGMYNDELKYAEGQLVRYNSTGEHIQTIQYDQNNTGEELYRDPGYITENRNGDVIVSDLYRVVVTDRGGSHRFFYTGPPSGSGLFPQGICTDALSHILVCDHYTKSVQMLDSDGHFLSLIQTSPYGIDTPQGLTYDDNTHLLWVGSFINNTVKIYRVIDRDSLIVKKLKGKVDRAWNEVEDVLVTSGSCEKDFRKIREVERLLNVKFKEFCIVSEDYKKYLDSQNTEDARNMWKEFDMFVNKCISIVKKTSNELETTKFKLLETLSHVSSSSSLQIAKAQAEKAKLELIKKEGELLKQKTDIETKISIVRQEKEILSAEADLSEENKIDLPVSTKEQLTSAYIMNHHSANTGIDNVQQNQPSFEQNPSNTIHNPPTSVYNPASAYQLPVSQT